MTLREKQALFSRKISVLIQVAFEMGYTVTLGDCYRDDRCNYGHSTSLHKKRLAVDLNLFCKGRYITDDEGHKDLHMIGELMGLSPVIKGDPNHYSLEHDGMR